MRIVNALAVASLAAVVGCSGSPDTPQTSPSAAQQGPAPGTPAPPPTVAFGETFDADGLSIVLTDVRIDNPAYDSMRGSRDNVTEEKYLLCTFKVVNTNEKGGGVRYFDPGSVFDASKVTVRDGVDNPLRHVPFGRFKLTGAMRIGDKLYPGIEMTHIEAFSIPQPQPELLLVDVDLSLFGGTGHVRFEVPYDSVTASTNTAPEQPPRRLWVGDSRSAA